MRVEFDLFKRRRISSLILCNPNGQELFSLSLAQNRRVSMSLNELSELTFELPKFSNKEVIPYYDFIKTRRIIKLEDIGQFLITKVEIDSDGITEIKKVTCKGLEFELSSKNLDVLEGTYNFYDPTNTEKSLLHIILSYIPNWSLSEVESSLWDIWRTFDIKDNNIYNFIMGEVQKAYDCVFIFNTFNRTIKVVKASSLPKRTDIYMSNRNLMKELQITEDADNIITALDVYGDGDLSIRTVNPLGTPTIYDFSYFATTEWMSQDLVNAINAWQTKIKNNESRYANLLITVKNLEKELLVLKSELTDLETEKKSLEQAHALAVIAKDDASCSLYVTQIANKEKQITAKNTQIKNKENQITTNNNSLKSISQSLSFSNNFTKAQMKELNPFIYQASVQNTNYSITDLTTLDEEREIMYNLYDWAKSELSKSCQPIWEFSVDSINFLNLIEYRETSNQLELGSEVTIEVDKEKELYAIALLLGYELDLDDFDDLQLKFSNVLRFQSSSWTFEELFDTTSSISKTFNFESNTWDVGKEAYSLIDDYMKSALDLTTQDIISSDNQEFTLTNVGLRGREYDPATQTYKQEQIWMTKNVLAFSDDGFRTTRTALGKITLPDGSKTYGLIADAIVGKLILGKKMQVQDEQGTLTIVGNKISIKNRQNVLKAVLGEYTTNKFGLALYNSRGNVVLDEDGILQTWQEGKCDNVANGYPLRLYIYLPSTTKSIRQALLRFKRDKFRAFSTATGGGGSISTSTNSGGYTSSSTNSGGYTSDSTGGGGGDYVSSTSDVDSWYDGSTYGGHNHGINIYSELATFGGTTAVATPDGKTEYCLVKGESGGYQTFVGSGNHEHAFELRLPNHTHSFLVPSHSHSFTVPNHSHSFTLSNHTHSIMYGIYENSGYPSSIIVKVNGTQVGGSYNSDLASLDIKNSLKIGTWNTIEISSNVLGRIDASCFIQALMSTD